MGFLKSIVSDNGLNVPDSYHRIDQINGNQDNIEFFITAYPSVDFYLSNKSAHPLVTNKYTFEPDVSDDATNLFRQSYAHLKKHENYKYVEDVFEEGQSPL